MLGERLSQGRQGQDVSLRGSRWRGALLRGRVQQGSGWTVSALLSFCVCVRVFRLLLLGVT